MLTKDCIDDGKVMSMGRQVLFGIGVALAACLFLWGIRAFKPAVMPEKKSISTSAPERNIALELQQEQLKELRAIRIAIEKLNK